jgi:hypothetical protein
MQGSGGMTGKGSREIKRSGGEKRFDLIEFFVVLCDGDF